MLVTILGFGTNWWARFGHKPEDRHRYTKHAAYFNSTGLQCGNKIRRHWIIPGLIRFNGVAGFNSHFPQRSLGETFECTELVFALGGNRVLFVKRMAKPVKPDYFLVVISSATFGGLDCQDVGWKSESALPIAVSQLRARQEVMLLMGPFDWVRTQFGICRLRTDAALPRGATLELLEEGIVS